jgi:formylglycine-generating enzyme required for sulfatase activity
MGHAHVLDALVHLFGTEDPLELRRLENFFFLNGHLPSPGTSLDEPKASLKGMIHIPPGSFVKGIDPEEVPFKRFDTAYYLPQSSVELDGFYIDEYPVTNAQYDRFVEDIGRNGHRFCHPDEPTGKVHHRNTLLDPRFGPDHPVTGIDWYDAYAYAKWQGKDLPGEEQWEKAARGTDGRIYPWGNEFDPAALNWLGELLGRDIRDIHEWRSYLIQIDETFPSRTTTPVSAYPKNKSPYGVRDMVGNAWEYTNANFYSSEPLEPEFKDKDPVSFMHDPGAFVLIKGGPWTGIPEMTTTIFRGKDLFTDRHNEIGFRCVVNV